MALATLVAISGPEKVSIQGPPPTMALVMDITRLKIITYRAIKTTGTLIVIYYYVFITLRKTARLVLSMPAGAGRYTYGWNPWIWQHTANSKQRDVIQTFSNHKK
jgi:hypothetical protein